MGKRQRGGQKREEDRGQLHTSLSLREQASGKKQSHNAKSLIKHKHLRNLAHWTSSILVNDEDNPSFGCLGAFFSRRFAEFGESLGISLDPSLFPCQRCETILRPGSNCNVRIEKNRAKHQNNVIYTCHFCSYCNLKRGTPKGYMRDLVPSKPSSLKPVYFVNFTVKKSNFSNVENEKTNEAPPPTVSKAYSFTDSPTSSLVKSDVKLLDSNRRKRVKAEMKGLAKDKPVSSAPTEKEQSSGTSKRRRKSWMTLKDIAKTEKHDRNHRFKKFSIPFVL